MRDNLRRGRFRISKLNLRDRVRTLAACFFLFSLFCALGTHARARVADGGANAAEILRMGVGARVPAMGEAAVASVKGVESLRYNPAGLGWTGRREAELGYHDIVLDVGLGSLVYASPWPAHGRGDAFAAGITYIDYGSAKRTTVADQTGSGGSNFGGKDFVLSAAYGTRIREAISVGVAGRMISSSIDNANATGFSLDFGLQWRPRERITVGAAVQNVGSNLKYYAAKEELPLTVRGGVAYELQPGRWILNADLEKTREEDVTLHFGTEYRVTDAFSLRAGFDGANRSDRGITAGIGVRQGSFELNYAYVPFGEFGANHRLGLRYDMGAPSLEIPPPVETPRMLEPLPELLPGEDELPLRKEEFAAVTGSGPAISDARPMSAAEESVPQDARSAAAPASEKEPEFGKGIVGSLLRSGDIAVAADNLEDAGSFYGAALAFEPENTRALYNCATVHYWLGNFAEARHYYERLLELDPNDEEARTYLGRAESRLVE